MKKIFSLLIICLFFFSCQSSSEDSEDKITREEFADISKNSTAAIDGYWESPSVFVLIYEQNSLDKKINTGKKDDDGNDIYESPARGHAVINAIMGNETIGIPVCVKVKYPDGQQLAYECAD